MGGSNQESSKTKRSGILNEALEDGDPKTKKNERFFKKNRMDLGLLFCLLSLQPDESSQISRLHVAEMGL
jgi:hypothetical protein